LFSCGWHSSDQVQSEWLPLTGIALREKACSGRVVQQSFFGRNDKKRYL
jgi:hypothetical protein